jgi:hypothetical protein
VCGPDLDRADGRDPGSGSVDRTGPTHTFAASDSFASPSLQASQTLTPLPTGCCGGKAPICCGNGPSSTCRPGLSRSHGQLKLPAFAATPQERGFP